MASVDLMSELRCSICIDIYDEPVTLPCGHNFCRNCIRQAWDHQGHGDSKCPECKQIYKKRPEPKVNLRLLNIAKAFQHTRPNPKDTGIYCTYCDSPVPAANSCLQCETSMCEAHLRKHNMTVQHALIPPTVSVRDRKCSVHKKILDYYCRDDCLCICESCRADEEHRDHQLESLAEASEKKKEKLRNVLEKMTTRKEKIEHEVQRLQERKTEIQQKATGVTERVTAMFRDIRRQLEDLEKKVLSEISKQEEKISLAASNLIRQLDIKRNELSMRIRGMEAMINMMDPLTVLQDSDRGDFPEAEDGDDTKIKDVGELTFSDALCTGFSDIVKCANIWFYIQEPADVTLGLNTAASNLNVSRTLKMARWSQRDEHHPESPERFEKYQVISGWSFSSGRHYWDVETAKSGGWGLGVCYPSIERSGDQSIIGENSASWCLRRLCLWRWYKQYSARHDGHITTLPHNVASNKIRIYVDYEAGQISFYDLCDPIRHLHTFTATFTEPLHAAFYVWGDWWYKDSWVRINSPSESLRRSPDWVNSHSIEANGE